MISITHIIIFVNNNIRIFLYLLLQIICVQFGHKNRPGATNTEAVRALPGATNTTGAIQKTSTHHCSSALMPKLYVFVGRGHDPADQVAMIEWLVEWYRVPSDCKS